MRPTPPTHETIVAPDGPGPSHHHKKDSHQQNPVHHHDENPQELKVVDTNVSVVVPKEDHPPLLVGLAGETTSTKAVKRDDDTESTISDDSANQLTTNNKNSAKKLPDDNNNNSFWSCSGWFGSVDKLLDMSNFCGTTSTVIPSTIGICICAPNEAIDQSSEEACEIVDTPLLETKETETNGHDDIILMEQEHKLHVDVVEETSEDVVNVANNHTEIKNADEAKTGAIIETGAADVAVPAATREYRLKHVIDRKGLSKNSPVSATVTGTLAPSQTDSKAKKIHEECLQDKTSTSPIVSGTKSVDLGESFKFQNLATGSFCDVVVMEPLVENDGSRTIVEEDAITSKQNVADESEMIAEQTFPASFTIVENDKTKKKQAAEQVNPVHQKIQSVNKGLDEDEPVERAVKTISLLVGVFDPRAPTNY